MRKVLQKALPLIIVAVMLCSLLIFFGVALNRDDGLGVTETNLALGANIQGGAGCKSAFDDNKMTSWTFAAAGSQATVDFGEEKEINALLLNEIGHNVKQFSIYTMHDGEWELKYRQNEIGVNRLATFYTVKTNKVKITFDQFKNVVSIATSRYLISTKGRDKKN